MIHLRIENQVESKIKSNQKSNWIKNQIDQKSKVDESWFTNLRIIGYFDFESKANQSESRIKLVRALILDPQLKI